MTDTALPVPDSPLGQAAPNRGPVDLMAEAAKLKFNADELAELKRLYQLGENPVEGKTPQTKP